MTASGQRGGTGPEVIVSRIDPQLWQAFTNAANEASGGECYQRPLSEAERWVVREQIDHLLAGDDAFDELQRELERERVHQEVSRREYSDEARRFVPPGDLTRSRVWSTSMTRIAIGAAGLILVGAIGWRAASDSDVGAQDPVAGQEDVAVEQEDDGGSGTGEAAEDEAVFEDTDDITEDEIAGVVERDFPDELADVVDTLREGGLDDETIAAVLRSAGVGDPQGDWFWSSSDRPAGNGGADVDVIHVLPLAATADEGATDLLFNNTVFPCGQTSPDGGQRLPVPAAVRLRPVPRHRHVVGRGQRRWRLVDGAVRGKLRRAAAVRRARGDPRQLDGLVRAAIRAAGTGRRTHDRVPPRRQLPAGAVGRGRDRHGSHRAAGPDRRPRPGATTQVT